MPLTSAPTGFEPALTAPEGVASSGADQRKRAHGRPFWTRIGHGADSRRSRPCRSPMVFHMPRSDRRVSLASAPVYLHRLRRGWRARRTPAQVTQAQLAAGRRLAAGGGSASSGSLTQAEKTGSPCQPLGAGLGSWFRESWQAAAATAKGCAKRAVATRLLAGLRAKPPGIAAGSGLVLYFCVAVIMHVRAGAFACHQGPRGVSGAFAGVFRARDSPRHSSSYHLTTLAAGIESMCVRGGVGGKGIGYPIGAG